MPSINTKHGGIMWFDQEDDNSWYADPLTDFGGVVAILAAFGIFCAVMFYGVSAFAKWWLS